MTVRHMYIQEQKKYIQNEGRLRQYDAVQVDERKQRKQEENSEQWVRGNFGEGEIYETNLFSKLFLLAAIKTSTIAPFGLGIEMEAGKPGWNDALNGLPGMLGASTSELFELKRLLQQLQNISVTSEEKNHSSGRGTGIYIWFGNANSSIQSKKVRKINCHIGMM